MGVVDEAVHDRVRVSRIADNSMPTVDGKLRSDERGFAAVALFEDFQQIVSRCGVQLPRDKQDENPVSRRRRYSRR